MIVTCPKSEKTDGQKTAKSIEGSNETTLVTLMIDSYLSTQTA